MMKSKSIWQKFVIVITGFMVFTSVAAVGEEKKSPQPAEFTGQSFAVYTLSRGRVVPEPARQVLEQLRRILEDLRAQKQVIRIEEERIGLEGETLLCAQFATAGVAHKTWDQAQRLIGDIELVNLKLESCDAK
jgi:hypothetical protein